MTPFESNSRKCMLMSTDRAQTGGFLGLGQGEVVAVEYMREGLQRSVRELWGL